VGKIMAHNIIFIPINIIFMPKIKCGKLWNFIT